MAATRPAATLGSIRQHATTGALVARVGCWRGGLSDRPGADRARRSTGGDVAQAAASNDGGGASGVEGAGNIEGVDAVRVSGSRARQVTRNNMSYALIVVDARRVAGVPATAWMDYVALVSLAQIDPTARAEGYDTILNVFNTPQTTQTGLTAWGRCFPARAVSRSRRVGQSSNRRYRAPDG
ncbi:MAG: hypothetical protein IPL62_00755 [Caulobacteraceae bacterium]|nr:hypothetical protein [Caulobacteraceae bacterium]